MVVVRSIAATEKEYGGGVGGYIGNNDGVCGGGHHRHIHCHRHQHPHYQLYLYHHSLPNNRRSQKSHLHKNRPLPN